MSATVIDKPKSRVVKFLRFFLSYGAPQMRRYARLRKYGNVSDRELTDSFSRIAEDLSASKFSGRLGIIVSDASGRFLIVDADAGRVDEWPRSSERMDSPPDFIVYAKSQTLLEITRGELSPVEAFLTGRLRYSGNQQFGVSLLRRLASSQDDIFEPCRETIIRADQRQS